MASKNKNMAIIRRSLVYPSVISQSHSIFIRHLDCGSCNACELELQALYTPVYDIVQYGIHLVASPRHADLLTMTGPYTCNMDAAARTTLANMPTPRVVTIGDCTQNGGDFKLSYAICEVPREIEKAIIAHVPGCPPAPIDILKTLLSIRIDL